MQIASPCGGRANPAQVVPQAADTAPRTFELSTAESDESSVEFREMAAEPSRDQPFEKIEEVPLTQIQEINTDSATAWELPRPPEKTAAPELCPEPAGFGGPQPFLNAGDCLLAAHHPLQGAAHRQGDCLFRIAPEITTHESVVSSQKLKA